MTGKSKGEQVQQLHETGLSVRAIARALDLSTQGVRYHLKRLGLPAVPNRDLDTEVAS